MQQLHNRFDEYIHFIKFLLTKSAFRKLHVKFLTEKGDGNLYGWGSNEAGQMGIKNEIGVELYETANFPTAVVNEDFANQKIVDFDIGEDIMAILLNNNEVYWSGIRMAYKPERLKLPKDIGKIKKIACCFKCVVVVTGIVIFFY